jgi:hypothetical protein
MNEYFEDYAIGFNLDEYYKIDVLNIATNKIFVDINMADYADKEMFIS